MLHRPALACDAHCAHLIYYHIGDLSFVVLGTSLCVPWLYGSQGAGKGGRHLATVPQGVAGDCLPWVGAGQGGGRVVWQILPAQYGSIWMDVMH